MPAYSNFSKKRQAVAELLRSLPDHPSAEEIHEMLLPQFPDLSLATVYRNLHWLCENHLAASLGVVNGRERFDRVLRPHAHLICRDCGAIRDVKKNFFGPSELGQISKVTGFAVESAQVLFTGLCEACSAKEDAPSPQRASAGESR